MNNHRVERLIDLMKERNIPQIIVSDPVAIFYLTGKWIHPGERLLALYIHESGKKVLIINELFPQEEDPDLKYVWYNDIDDGVEIMSKHIADDKVIGIDKEWPAKFLLRLQEIFPDKKYVNSSLLVDEIRMIKDENEKEKMRESSRITDEVMDELIPWAGKGLTEKELNKKVREIYAKHGVTEMSFDPITAYAEGAADPHHVTDDSKGKYGDCVVLDIGGIHDNYASDITRTVFIGEISDRQKEIYDIVLEANRRGIEAAKPGNRMCDVDKAARDYIEEKGFGKYFTHRTGHSIGLEDHEYGDVSSTNEQVIRPGQCFSVEPGIYIKDEGIGVRIEDLVIITEDGCEVITKYPKDIIVVEESAE